MLLVLKRSEEGLYLKLRPENCFERPEYAFVLKYEVLFSHRINLKKAFNAEKMQAHGEPQCRSLGSTHEQNARVRSEGMSLQAISAHTARSYHKLWWRGRRFLMAILARDLVQVLGADIVGFTSTLTTVRGVR